MWQVNRLISWSVSLKVLERRRDEELFYEEFRVKDSDVSGTADERVCVGGQRVVHAVPHERRVVVGQLRTYAMPHVNH